MCSALDRLNRLFSHFCFAWVRALWSAPLLVATDLRNLSVEKRSIVTNQEVIAIDQDALVQAGDRIVLQRK
eukprot:m.59296 g.59296  ORF g.59296 m.59296 type:complete len:71 (-) comp13816_c0_seq1:269-481(-)